MVSGGSLRTDWRKGLLGWIPKFICLDMKCVWVKKGRPNNWKVNLLKCVAAMFIWRFPKT